MSKILVTSAIAPEFIDQKIQIGPAIITEEPTQDRDIASKLYVDTAVAGAGGITPVSTDINLTYTLPYCTDELTTTATLTQTGDLYNLTIPFMDDAMIARSGATPREIFQITFTDVALRDLGAESASCGSLAIYLTPAAGARSKYVVNCHVVSAAGNLSIVGHIYWPPTAITEQLLPPSPSLPVPEPDTACEVSGILSFTWYA